VVLNAGLSEKLAVFADGVRFVIPISSCGGDCRRASELLEGSGWRPGLF